MATFWLLQCSHIPSDFSDCPKTFMLKYCHFVRLEVIQGLWRIVLDELNEQDFKKMIGKVFELYIHSQRTFWLYLAFHNIMIVIYACHVCSWPQLRQPFQSSWNWAYKVPKVQRFVISKWWLIHEKLQFLLSVYLHKVTARSRLVREHTETFAHSYAHYRYILTVITEIKM